MSTRILPTLAAGVAAFLSVGVFTLVVSRTTTSGKAVPAASQSVETVALPAGEDGGATVVAVVKRTGDAPRSETLCVSATVQPATPPVFGGGAPQLAPVDGTRLSFATNTTSAVLRTSGGVWFTCENGVWFSALASGGPWRVATALPPDVADIPAGHPVHFLSAAKVRAFDGSNVWFDVGAGYYADPSLPPEPEPLPAGAGNSASAAPAAQIPPCIAAPQPDAAAGNGDAAMQEGGSAVYVATWAPGFYWAPWSWHWYGPAWWWGGYYGFAPGWSIGVGVGWNWGWWWGGPRYYHHYRPLYRAPARHPGRPAFHSSRPYRPSPLLPAKTTSRLAPNRSAPATVSRPARLATVPVRAGVTRYPAGRATATAQPVVRASALPVAGAAVSPAVRQPVARRLARPPVRAAQPVRRLATAQAHPVSPGASSRDASGTVRRGSQPPPPPASRASPPRASRVFSAPARAENDRGAGGGRGDRDERGTGGGRGGRR